MTEELRKEADDYADKHAFRVPYDGSNKFYDDVDFKASKDGYLAGAEPREKRIAELKKENAELKEKLEIEQNARGDWFGKAVTKDRRLTEAKDLLAKWVELYKPKSNTALPTPIQVDTEQFLNNEMEK